MRAIFLDRDGVICENRAEHVKSWAEFQFLPQVKDSLAALSRLELPIIVVTNQAAINRGLVTDDVVEEIHRRMIAELNASGARIDRILYCPHRPDEKCNCRKPEPGMLLQAARELDIDLAGSYMVGDAASDLVAGDRVGCRTFLVLTGRGNSQLWAAFRAMSNRFAINPSLQEAAAQIIEAEREVAIA